MTDDYTPEDDDENDNIDTEDEESPQPLISRAMMDAWLARLATGNTVDADAVVSEIGAVLSDYVRHSSAPAKTLALECLAQTRSIQVIPVLHRALAEPGLVKSILSDLAYHFILQEIIDESDAGQALLQTLTSILLQSTDDKVKVLAARCMSYTPAAAASLLQALADSSQAVRDAALSALETIRAPSVVPALIAMYEGRPEHQKKILEILGGTHHTQARDFLLKVVRDGGKTQRRTAVSALRDVRHISAITALCDLLENEMSTFAGVAIKSLNEIITLGMSECELSSAQKCEIAAALCRALPQVKKKDDVINALEILGALGEASAVPAMAVFLQADDDIRDAAIKAIGKIACPESLHHLFAALQTKSQRLQIAAADVIWQQDVSSPAPDLLPLLQSKVLATRAKAQLANALVMSDCDIPSRLLREWMDSTDESLCEAAICVLMTAPDREFLNDLLGLLNDDLNDTTVPAMQALGALGDARAIPALMRFTTSEHSSLRRRALLVLAGSALIIVAGLINIKKVPLK